MARAFEQTHQEVIGNVMDDYWTRARKQNEALLAAGKITYQKYVVRTQEIDGILKALRPQESSRDITVRNANDET